MFPVLSPLRLEVVLSVRSRIIVMYGCITSSCLADFVFSITPREVTA